MQILFLASEVAPFSKTGGLGDVASALPRALASRGHEVAVVTPRHGTIDPATLGLERLPLALRGGQHAAALWVRRGPATVYFVEHERFFGARWRIYGELDDAQRYAAFTRLALDVPRALALSPRIVHLHDWQTALGAWMLRHEHGAEGWPGLARSVFTIHNLAYQGVFPKHVLPALGLPWEVFRYEAMEFYDQLNFMKAGLVFSDVLTTVSPTYAREILTPEHGRDLDALLRNRAGDLHGILNGIDTTEWDPATDRHLPARFRAGDLRGKAACKKALQRELGLPVRAEVPLIVMVGRLAEQKGIDLVAAVLPELISQDVQLAVLGSGGHDHEQVLARTARERSDRLAVRIGFDEGLAHRMEAGGDIFLMPSRFEPCGLNQMYSLRYGTVPVVRSVGGLVDTVEDFDGWRSGTGFRFADYQPRALLTAVKRALDVFRDQRAWAGIVSRGMAIDNSWDASASRYEALFESLLEKRRA